MFARARLCYTGSVTVVIIQICRIQPTISSGITAELNSRGNRFERRAGYRLYSLRFFLVFLSPYKIKWKQCLEVYCVCFLHIRFHLTVFYIIILQSWCSSSVFWRRVDTSAFTVEYTRRQNTEDEQHDIASVKTSNLTNVKYPQHLAYFTYKNQR